jgi:hypothetical protein
MSPRVRAGSPLSTAALQLICIRPRAQDVIRPKHGAQYHGLVEYLQRNEWPAWPDRRELMRKEHWGSDVRGELWSPFGPRDFWFLVMTWWLGTSITFREPERRAAAQAWAGSADCGRRQAGSKCSRAGVGAYPLHGGALVSPLGFMFAVDRAFLEAQYRMCKVGVRALPRGLHGAPAAAALPAPGFDYNPLVYGHVNERLPYFLFGHEYAELPMPECVWHGDHATMNCSQPLVDRIANESASAFDAQTLKQAPIAMPRATTACRPFDNCGSTG